MSDLVNKFKTVCDSYETELEKLVMQKNALIYVVKEIHNQACQHDDGISSRWLEHMTESVLKQIEVNE